MAYKPEQIDEIFNKVINKIILGNSLRSVLREEGMPNRVTFYKWLNEDESKINQYARACEIRADNIFDEILEIADDSQNDYTEQDLGDGVIVEKFNPENVQRSRLKVDSRKWVLSKMNPKKYGDKQETTLVLEKPIFNGLDLDVPEDNSSK